MISTASVASPIASQYLRLHLADSIGPILLGRLIQRFGSIEDVLGASASALEQVEDIGPRRSAAILEARHSDRAEREIEAAARAGARIICWEDPDYPTQLRHCNDPPICLYVRGTLLPEDAVGLAIVGSRQCSRYGHEQARRFASLLAGAGYTVVSGLARGIDSCAHEGALAVQGRTLAVLGSGVDLIYPPENAPLAERVMEAGAILSEDPIGSAPTADSFPRRNRIIAGLSLGVLVVEASQRSGALITARLAGEYNREVFALPGRVDVPTSLGTNKLIRDGAAKLVLCLEDIVDELGEVGRMMSSAAGPPPRRIVEDEAAPLFADAAVAGSPAAVPRCTAEEQKILNCLSDGMEADIDEIISVSDLPAGKVSATLTALQLKGLVRSLPGGRFVRGR